MVTAAFIQKVTLSQDDTGAGMQFVSRSKKHHLAVAVGDCVFSPAVQGGSRGGGARNPGVSNRKQ